jgi:ABC-type antimicrobial peptide transport system permease subunit
MVAAGLLGETVIRLGARPLGFTPDGAVVANVVRDRDRRPRDPALQTGVRPDRPALLQMSWAPAESLLGRLSTLPGVTSVAAARTAPFVDGLEAAANVRPEVRPVEEAQLVRRTWVSTDYFDAIGASLLDGRTFVDADRLTLPPPVVISRRLERQLFGDRAVGRVIQGTQRTWTVVGVIADVRQRGFADDELAMMYEPLRDVTLVNHLIVRASGDASAAIPMIREAIEGHEAPMFVTSIAPMDDLVTETIAVERSRALLSSAYGLVALVLASVGLFGLAARLVAERRREIGIRVALGAGRRDVRRLVMADAWIITGIGLVVGIPSAIAMSRLAEGLLYGVAPAAPHVLVVAALGLTLAALVATAIPAIRANRIDPSAMLRDE